ncbi:MAG: thioredoxin family protein [Balneolaceae bacterium]|nr:thioredoxin family protein [Balneolaceae bacterium]MCH8549956.1 thioredoxin family protein [Balneolaceae bacterium]
MSIQNQTIVKEITPNVIRNAMDYARYRSITDALLEENKTTGDNHSEAMIAYTKMNVHRMKRLDKQTKLSDELRDAISDLDREMIWLVLTEAWCGDAAQIVPVFEKVAEETGLITTKYILRDEHQDIMDRFLQNGRSRSIPKLICLDPESLEVLADWGPRPTEAQELYDSLRDRDDLEMMEVAERLHKWYADDRTESTQRELAEMIQGVSGI